VSRSLRTLVDVLLLTGIIVMGVTGIGMYLAPSGRVARATHWTYLGLDKHTLGEVHTYFGFAMLAIVTVHVLLNWKPLKALLKNILTDSRELIRVAVTFVLLIVGLEIYLYGG